MQEKDERLKGFLALIYAMVLLFELINDLSLRTIEVWRFFYQFTQQSNILILIWLILYGITRFKSLKIKKHVENNTIVIGLTVFISITYFIVAFVLQPIYLGLSNPISNSGELLLHHLTPIVMWIFYFTTKTSGQISYKTNLLVLIYPLLYVGINLIVGSNVTYIAEQSPAYAYDFINPNSYSNILIYLIVIAGLAAVFAIFTLLLTKFKKYLESDLQLEVE